MTLSILSSLSSVFVFLFKFYSSLQQGVDYQFMSFETVLPRTLILTPSLKIGWSDLESARGTCGILASSIAIFHKILVIPELETELTGSHHEENELLLKMFSN